MLVSEYIVSFLISKGISDVFGYPGGMITYFMEALDKQNDQINAHLFYHEQGAAFAACAYGMTKGLPGVAYSTSGPGATNLITGIVNAYFDSIPTIFITGQVNMSDTKKQSGIRQRGFQETDIVSIVKPITKAAWQITRPQDIRWSLEKSFNIAMEGRKGPVLLDIPMNIQRSEVLVDDLSGFNATVSDDSVQSAVDYILKAIKKSKRPLILAGNGIWQGNAVEQFRNFVSAFRIPVVTSMLAVDVLSKNNPYNFGFVGAYGHRWANFITEKADLIFTLGTRLDNRQTGSNTKLFAPKAKILRLDIDEEELKCPVHKNEHPLQCDIADVLIELNSGKNEIDPDVWKNWRAICQQLKAELSAVDDIPENKLVEAISEKIPKDAIVTTDVGQNQVWVAQSFAVQNQRILFSGGHGAMGFSLPAAIGACIANGRKTVYAFTGDGGLQMNIQELQTIVREKLPIKILVLDNQSLGMIRHFQEMYFQKNYTQTIPHHGYTVPDFVKVAEAYGISARTIQNASDLGDSFQNNKPELIHVKCRTQTYVFPKLAINKPIYDQEPLMDRKLLERMRNL